ncbi:hypothetical protein [Cytobacillus praedii]|nr:hypothetical protein [Cytobacillus praedii]
MATCLISFSRLKESGYDCHSLAFFYTFGYRKEAVYCLNKGQLPVA